MNSKTRTLIFTISAFFILAGATLYLSVYQQIAPYLFSIGAAGFTVSYLTLPTKEMDFRTRRLHRYNIMAGILMIFASALMFAGRKEWVICLTIAAFFQLYTAFINPGKKE